MGFFDSLFGSKQEKTGSTELPDWVTEQAKTNLNAAGGVANRPYTPYPYQRIASRTGDQTTADSIIRGLAPGYSSSSGQAGDMITGGATADAMQLNMPRLIDDIPGQPGSAQGSLEDYMSTYTDSVLGDTLDENQRQYGMAMQSIGDPFTMAGGHNDDRRGVYEAELSREHLRNQGDTTNRVMQQAFEQAMSLRDSDLNRGLSTFNSNVNSYEGGLNRLIGGGAALPGAEGTELGNTLTYTDALNESGEQQQGQEQQNMDLGYNDFLRQLGYPEAMLDTLNKTLSATPYGQSEYGQAPSTASSLLSAGSSLASLFLSDRRLKTQIKRLGQGIHGLGIYSYRYIWGGPKQVGVMSDEVREVMPEAVVNLGGYDAVDYAMILR